MNPKYSYKLRGFSNLIQDPIILYKVKTQSEIRRGLVKFNDSSLICRGVYLPYDSVISIEYSILRKASNVVLLGYGAILTGIGANWVVQNSPGSAESNLGLIVGIPGVLITAMSIYEIAKPQVYVLREYSLSTKKVFKY